MLFVFDLDFTLWDCGGTWCDLTQPPYLKKEDKILDAERRNITLYQDVRFLLETLENQNVEMAVASRTTAPDQARKLMALFDIDKFFQYQEIFPGSKVFHFKNLQQKTGFQYSEMYFFDDELRNIEEVQKMGVHCVLIENGLQKKHLIKILAKSNPEKEAIS
jgi:magnesium-dependent phosphatase 1